MQFFVKDISQEEFEAGVKELAVAPAKATPASAPAPAAAAPVEAPAQPADPK
jgi:hypothetical protein